MDQIIRTCSGIAAAALLAAMSAPARADVPDSLTAYVLARAADAAGERRAATAAYREALVATPDNPIVAQRAYREALITGDMPLVERSVATLRVAGAAPPDSVLIEVASAAHARDWGAADAAADRLAAGPLDFLGPAIKAWVAFQRGASSPEAGLDLAAKNPLARRFNAETRALLLIAGNRVDQGVAELRTLVGAGGDNADLRVAAAQLLTARGNRDAAQALLAGDDPVLAALRERPGRGVGGGAAFGISRLFVRLAADLVDGDAKPLAILLCRAALHVDPRDDRARLTLAGALSNAGAQEQALAMLGQIDPKGIYAATARTMSITIFSRTGEPGKALAAAQAAASARNADADDAQRLGDLLVGAGRYGDGAAAYATAMERRGAASDWALNMQRGGALEQAGRWDEALPYLRRAVELAPGQAHALNYLGYAQVERGENLDAARALHERASKLQPDDAAITDSLGWAYVRSGQPTKALPLLERAARAEPGDATINEHLGDTYWALGRRIEARYSWRAAAVYADEAEAARLAGKLANGIAN